MRESQVDGNDLLKDYTMSHKFEVPDFNDDDSDQGEEHTKYLMSEP